MAQTIDSAGNFFTGSGANPGVHTFNLVAGLDRVVVVAVPRESASTVDTVTFDGAAMASRLTATHTLNANLSLDWFTYAVPNEKAAGAYSLVITYSGVSASVSPYAWQATGAASAVPSYVNAVEVGDTVTTATLAPTVAAGSAVFAAAANSAATPTWSFTGGTVTKRYENDEAAYTTACADGIATGGVATVNAVSSTTSTYKLLGVLVLDAAPEVSVAPTQLALSVTGTGLKPTTAVSWLVPQPHLFATVGASPTRYLVRLTGPTLSAGQLLRRQLQVLTGAAAHERVTIVECDADGDVVVSPPFTTAPAENDRVRIL